MARSRNAIVVLVFGTALFGAAIAARGVANPWLTNAAAAVLVLVATGFVLRPRGAEIFRAHPHQVGVAIALAVAMVVATHLCFSMATSLIPSLQGTVESLYRNIDKHSPGKAITVVLICLVVVAEELLWRGVAVELCAPHLNRLRTGYVVVVLYAIPQLIGGTWVLVAAALVAGGVFTAQRLLSGSLVSPIVTHAIWSTCVFSLLPLT